MAGAWSPKSLTPPRTVREAAQRDWIFHHGTPDERSWETGSAYGIHVGTEEAAHQALNARIGKPLEGRWDGTREYGKTLLDPAQATGVERGGEVRHPTGRATYSSGHQVPMDARPSVFPVRITGPMIGHPAAPVDDTYANGRMKSQISRGNARSGYFYRNTGEDAGSVSAAVPSAAHLERVHYPREAVRQAAAASPYVVYHGAHHDDVPSIMASGLRGGPDQPTVTDSREGAELYAHKRDWTAPKVLEIHVPRSQAARYLSDPEEGLPAEGTVHALRETLPPSFIRAVHEASLNTAVREDSLAEVGRRGYCTEGWNRWQQGKCGTYAVGLMRLKPDLKFGVAGVKDEDGWIPQHYFAHDDTYAYDSAGRHPLPYKGVHGDMDVSELGHSPRDWSMPEEEHGEKDVPAAQEHARRNRILEGGFGPRTAARWSPSSGIFGPTTGLDQRLFTDKGELRPGVRRDVMERLDRCIRSDHGLAGSDWQDWTRVYLSGGSVSEWAGSRPNETAQDLDVIVGIDLREAQRHNAFESMTIDEACAALNKAFWSHFNEDGWQPDFGGTWDLTAYANPRAWAIRDIKPYAAYNLTAGVWAVQPPHLPEHSVADFSPALVAMARAVAAQARAVLRLDEPMRTREARALWDRIHADRSRAFSDEGEGWQDAPNVIEKWLAYAPHGLLGKIRDLAMARTAGREEQLAEMDPHSRASSLAQEYARALNPRLATPLDLRNGQSSVVLSRWLSDAGHPRAADAYVAQHRDPGRMRSNTGRGPDGEPAVILHPDRWDYGTMAHETAHLITDHQTGRLFGHPHGPDGAHDDHWARNYAGLLNRISPDAGDDFLAEREHHKPGGMYHEAAAGRADGMRENWRPGNQAALYHGSPRPWQGKPRIPATSDEDREVGRLAGFYTTTSQEEAARIGGPHVSEHAVSLRNPLHADYSGTGDPGAEVWEKLTGEHYPPEDTDIAGAVREAGHDGVVLHHRDGREWHVAVHPSALSMHREAAAEPVYYHGTSHQYQRGDQIEHHYWKKYPDRADFRENSPLYTTTDPSLAGHMAELRGGSEGHLYEVRPTGPLKPDETANGVVRGDSSWMTSHPLHVTREVPRHEWPQDLNSWQMSQDEIYNHREGMQREAAAGQDAWYHVSPAANRENIQQSGLTKDVSRAGRFYLSGNPHEMLADLQEGTNADFSGHDVWRVDTRGLRLRDDPESPSHWEARYTTQRIGPERLTREAVSGYDGLTGRSAMIYLDLPPGTVRPVPGGVDESHITLVYLGKNVSDEKFAEACRRAKAAAAKSPPMDGVLRGIGIFPPSKGSDGKVPAFVPAFVGGIGLLRRELEDLSASEHKDYKPHVTLAYLEEGDSLPAPHPAVPLHFDRLHVKRGDDIRSYPLGGMRREAAAEEHPTFYHGSGKRYPDGHVIDPAEPHKKLYPQSDPSKAYFSDNRWNARNWANTASPSGKGHVYEVEPTGHYEDDPHYAGPEENGIYDLSVSPVKRINVYQTGHPLRVVRRLPAEEDIRHEAAATGPEFFHGSRHDLPPGTHLTPDGANEAGRKYLQSSEKHVFYTEDKGLARAYGPNVYRVQPLAPPAGRGRDTKRLHDPEPGFPREHEYLSTRGFQVIDKVDPDEAQAAWDDRAARRWKSRGGQETIQRIVDREGPEGLPESAKPHYKSGR